MGDLVLAGQLAAAVAVAVMLLGLVWAARARRRRRAIAAREHHLRELELREAREVPR